MLAFAIMLAVGALTIGTTTVAPISSAAVTDGLNPQDGAGQPRAHRVG
jgi:hypothetical protein